MNQNIISYEGRVQVKYLVHGKEVIYKGHNEGLNAMFKFLCQALTGDLTTLSNQVPTYLDIRSLYSDPTKGETWDTCLYSTLSLSDHTYKFDSSIGKWVARFSVVISYNMIDFDKVAAHSDGQLYLYLLSANRDEFARLMLDEEQIKLTDIIPGTQALVEWTMLLQNAKETN